METREAILHAHDHDQPATCVTLAANWLRSHSNDAWIYHIHAKTLYTLRRYEEALAVYDEAIGRFPGMRWAFFTYIGLLYRNWGKLSEAEMCHLRTVDELPNMADGYVVLGAVQACAGKLTEAEETHRKGAQCELGCIDEAWHNLGLVLRAQGRYAEAADCFRTAIELDPEYEFASKALEDVTTVLSFESRKNPGAASEEDRRNAILQAYCGDQAATCVTLAADWLATHGPDAFVVSNYAEMLYKMCRYDDALSVYRDMMEGDPNGHWPVYGWLGELYEHWGNYSESEKWRQMALDELSTYAPNFLRLGAIQLRQGKLTEAVRLFFSRKVLAKETAGC